MKNWHRRFISSFYLLPFTFCLLAPAAGPATQPASQVRTWFDQLADPDSTVRETARDSLLGLTAADLPTLQRIVANSRPLKPSQRAAIVPIVYHVFKSGIPYELSPAGEGFLGVTFDFLIYDLETDDRRGVIITDCEQGFPAYRMLRPGDVVKGIEQIRGLTFENTEQFRSAVSSFRGGETIVLQIEREGKELRIPVELRVRPAWLLADPQINAWRAELQAQADAYWKENFASLLEDGPA